MPINDDDAAAHGGGGPLKYWLTYKVWGVAGYWIVAGVALVSFLVGLLF